MNYNDGLGLALDELHRPGRARPPPRLGRVPELYVAAAARQADRRPHHRARSRADRTLYRGLGPAGACDLRAHRDRGRDPCRASRLGTSPRRVMPGVAGHFSCTKMLSSSSASLASLGSLTNSSMIGSATTMPLASR